MIIELSLLSGSPCNDFVDDVLSQMKADKDFFQEPYEIPENERSFAVYDLEYGHVYGLSTVHRIEDVVVVKKGKDRHIKVYLGAGEIRLQSSIKKKFLSFGKSANMNADVPFVTMELDVVPKPDGSKPDIRNFKVDEVKGMVLKFSGAGVLKDFGLNAFASSMGRFFKGMVKRGLEDKLKKFMTGKFLEINVPTECLNDGYD